MDTAPGRRAALTMMGLGIAAGAAGLAALHGGVASAAEASLLLPGAKSLEELTARLSRTPRRRDFKTVPMILNDPDQWNHAALSAVIAYRGAPKVCARDHPAAGLRIHSEPHRRQIIKRGIRPARVGRARTAQPLSPHHLYDPTNLVPAVLSR